MRRSLLVVFAAALASGFVLTSALADSPFTDPVGDATGNAPDITAVQVSNDSGGNITFHVAVANGTPESELTIWLDTDKNASTGDNGYDYRLGLTTSADPKIDGWWLDQRVDDRWIEAPSHSTVTCADDARTYVDFRINKSDLGATSGFAFQVWAERYTADAVTGADYAPDGYLQTFAYTLTTPPMTTTPPATTPPPTPTAVKPIFGTATTVPAKLVAGKKVVFTLAVNRSDTGAPLTTGKMVCDPSYMGIVIKHAESFTGGTAKLVFTVPKAAKGKTVKVKVTIVNGKQSATKVVAYKIA
jgi:hypothetical protein